MGYSLAIYVPLSVPDVKDVAIDPSNKWDPAAVAIAMTADSMA